MGVHKLDSFFNPRRIAITGVSINPNSVSGKVVTNLVGSGFKGVVYPVNPDSEAVFGIPCYKSLNELPNTPDLVVICNASKEVPDVVEKAGESGVRNIIIMSAGFKEIGAEGLELEERIKSSLRKYSGLRILGPNCLGIIVPSLNLNVSFASGIPKSGNIAFISQSGALCTSVLDWAIEKKIGFSYFISIGNTLDVDYADLIDFIGEDDKTKSIVLYIESVNQARKFMTSARSFARTKPIVAYKAGRFPESAKVAASHTGAMAAEDAIYDAAFKRMGVTRVFDIGEIFDVVELISRNRIPKGARLGIVTNAGGPGVMAVDALIAEDGVLAELSDETYNKLNESLPPYWSKGNPVDVLGDANSKRIAKASQILFEDKTIDAVLVILTPQAMTNPAATASELSKISEAHKKPLLAAFLGGEKIKEGVRILNDNGIPVYSTPEQAVRAFMKLVTYARNLELLYETPEDINVKFSPDREKLRYSFDTLIPDKTNILPENLSKSVLEAYGITTSKPYKVAALRDLKKTADIVGYPIVMKVDSHDITHKSDVGGVILNIEDYEMLSAAYVRMMNSIKDKMPDARVEGVTLQKMIKYKDSVELILGIKRDETFGTVIMVGMGGTGAELFKDRVIGFPPLNESLAYNMLASLKIFPLLKGYRGSKPVNLNVLIETLIRLSYLAADYPEITELDINPLLAHSEGAIALDARVVVDKSLSAISEHNYDHLAIKPYPDEYIRKINLNDGQEVTFRPIKPEDEPMWTELLASCSRESIYSRFRFFFQWDSHEVAARYCYIDYDRELAIVAEIVENGKRKLIGVGRLIADPDHENVEYAILIMDSYQNRDLGGLLTDYCFEIAKKWGLKRIVAQTTSDNKRMIAVFEKRGFEIDIDPRSSLVEVSKPLDNLN